MLHFIRGGSSSNMQPRGNGWRSMREDKSTGYDASNNETNCQGSRREDKLVQRNEERLLGLSRGMHHIGKKKYKRVTNNRFITFHLLSLYYTSPCHR